MIKIGMRDELEAKLLLLHNQFFERPLNFDRDALVAF